MKVEDFKRFSLKMLRCEVRAFPVCTAYRYTISRPSFYSAENAHAYESGPRGLRRRDVHCGFYYWPLAVNMRPAKVCPQCKAAVPGKWKACERCDLSFDPNEKQSVICERKVLGKLKTSCTKACERASEIRERTLHTPVGRNKTECPWQAWESHEVVIDCSQHKSALSHIGRNASFAVGDLA